MRVQLAAQTAEMLLASFNCIKSERSECGDGVRGGGHTGRRPQQGIIYTKYSELNYTAKPWRPLQRDEEAFKWQQETVTPGPQREAQCVCVCVFVCGGGGGASSPE